MTKLHLCRSSAVDWWELKDNNGEVVAKIHPDHLDDALLFCSAMSLLDACKGVVRFNLKYPYDQPNVVSELLDRLASQCDEAVKRAKEPRSAHRQK